MTRKSSLTGRFIASIFVLLIGLLLLSSVSEARGENQSDVPESWLDSLVANEWRIENKGRFSSYRMKKIETLLKKSGEIKKSDTSFILVKIDPDGVQERFLTDEAGTVIESMDENQQQNHTGEPLKAVHLERRSGYRYHYETTEAENCVRVVCKPNDDSDNAIFMAIEVDTTQWIIRSLEKVPSPLPDKLKELTLKIDYVPYEEGRARPASLRSNAHASVLFMNIYVRIEMEFFDYQP
jgi:hypothetical protein